MSGEYRKKLGFMIVRLGLASYIIRTLFREVEADVLQFSYLWSTASTKRRWPPHDLGTIHASVHVPKKINAIKQSLGD